MYVMGRKLDHKQVDAIASKYKMSFEQRKAFGKFVEQEKRYGYGGTLNYRKDFTWEELEQKAQEFLEEI
jgi:hypothetical protein